MNWDVLKPGYTITIRTAAQARLYNRLLVAKIVVALILLGLMAYASGWNWYHLAIGAGIGTAWYAASRYLRHRRQKAAAAALQARATTDPRHIVRPAFTDRCHDR